MTFGSGQRRFWLTAHITSSVAWLGAVASFLVLSIVGIARADPRAVLGVYVAMDVLAWYLILPLCLASLVTGIVQGLGTRWGLFRHYWVLIKLIINVVSTLVLLLHMRPIAHLAEWALEGTLERPEAWGTRVQMVVASALAAVALLVAVVLSVYKPRGLTPYGWRREQESTELGGSR